MSNKLKIYCVTNKVLKNLENSSLKLVGVGKEKFSDKYLDCSEKINIYSKATAENIDDSDKFVGKLITRMLTVDCPNELMLANKSDPLAINKAFELVGRVAMQELMSNQDTMQALTNYAKYTDQEKINALLSK